MNFCEGGNTADATVNVERIMDFLAQALSWPARGEQLDLSAEAATGLFIIITACKNTLEEVNKPDHP